VLREALTAIEAASNALMAETADVPLEGTTDAIFEIDATLKIPPQGFSLKAAQRLVLAFGRRRHIATVPVSLLFGRAIRRASDAERANQDK
jgi:hypothetical protein